MLIFETLSIAAYKIVLILYIQAQEMKLSSIMSLVFVLYLTIRVKIYLLQKGFSEISTIINIVRAQLQAIACPLPRALFSAKRCPSISSVFWKLGHNACQREDIIKAFLFTLSLCLQFIVGPFLVFFLANYLRPYTKYQVIIMFRILLLILQIFIFLKLDKRIDWTWSQVFWDKWILYGLLVVNNFTIVLTLVNKIIQSCTQR